MKLGIRDEIQQVQLEMLQDLLESRIKASFGEENWMEVIFETIKTRANDKVRGATYRKIAEKIKKEKAGNITVRDFDVTLTSALLLFDLFQICSVGDDITRNIDDDKHAPKDSFLKRVAAVRQSKNDLVSHISDLSDAINVNLELWSAVLKLKELLVFLQNSKWVKYNILNADAQHFSYEEIREVCSTIKSNSRQAIPIYKDELFLKKYSERIEELILEMDGSPCRTIKMAVQYEGKAVEGFRIAIFDSEHNEFFSGEINSEPISLYLPLGSYVARPKKRSVDRYELEDNIPFEVSFRSGVDNLIVLEAGMNDDKRFEEAFDILNSKDDPESALMDLRQLANRKNIYAALVLSYIYCSELMGTQDPDDVQRDLYMNIAKEKLDSEKWGLEAKRLEKDGKKSRAIALYMGDGMDAGNAASLRLAANMCVESKKQERNCNMDLIKSLYYTAARWGDSKSKQTLRLFPHEN